MTARVRFAPAPTGFLHVGSARSALFNWLYAQSVGGELILRIEDTDAALRKPEFIDAIVKPLQTLGITWDEGPYYQSQRQQFHVDAVNQLVEKGHAYFCNLTRDDADALAAEAGLPSGYHGWSRDKGLPDGPDSVVRFRTPDEGEVVFNDIIRGEMRFTCAELEDFVIRRSDGTPTFLVANAVDDADMSISHVIRGEDLLNTTPKVLLLWDALDLGDKPIYAHLPLLVNEQRKKLSKRRDDVSLIEFLTRGYLPAALVNHLALLGWGPPDDIEIRPIEEIVELFKLENVNKGSAFFDIAKLDHINGEYIRALPVEEFIALAEPHVYGVDTEVTYEVANYRPMVFEAVAEHVQQRVAKLSDIPQFIEWLFVDQVDYDERSWTKAMKKGKQVPEILDGIIEAFTDVEWNAEALNAAVGAVGDALGARSQVPARVAITGRNSGIPMWDAVAMLDRDVVLGRLRAARDLL
ncbi:MAG: glutamate--tRNA ligase [Acidimicrobiales bacterium]|nr:glutamate--tRNA ligase [Acidimicrobiales bacterium]RZV41208.1 MAG: glutamate--tRNA ligase [Acidimicrobiales bacterium]